MKSILKTTLVAAAVAAAAGANAAVITGNQGSDSVYTGKEWPLVSSEGLAIQETVSLSASQVTVDIELEADYQETDLFIVTIAGATINTKASTPSVVTGTTSAPGAASDFELLGTDAEAGTLTFRPTAGTTISAGDFHLEGVVLDEFSGAVTVATKGVTVQGIDIDQGAATPVALAASEFSVKTGTALNGVIDVEKERKEFVGGLTDNFGITVGAGADIYAVTAGTASLDVAGENLDFLYDKDGKLDSSSYDLDGLTEDTAKTALEGDVLSLTSSDAWTATTDAFGVTFTADGVADENAQALEAQTFSADVTLGYTSGSTAGSVETAGLAVGAWTLSGATVNMYYMPFGSGISQVIYLSNDGKVTGDIELTAFDEAGNVYGPVALDVQANAGAVTRLGPAIDAALTEEGFTGTGKLDITLVVNSPAADIDVYGAYNVRGDRVTVPVVK